MGAGRHSRQHRHGLSLAAGRHDDDLVIRVVPDVLDVDLKAGGDLQIAHALCEPHRHLDASAVEDHFLPAVFGEVHDLLNPRHVGGEKGDDDPPPAGFGDAGQGAADLPGRDGISFLFHVGGVGQKGQDPPGTQFGEPVDVGRQAVGIVVADLEIPGVDHAAVRRLDAEPHTVHDAVANPDELDLEDTELDSFSSEDFMELRRVGLAELLEPIPDDPEGERGPENRHVGDSQQEWQPAHMVLVGVGENHRRQPLGVLPKVLHVGDHEIAPQHVAFRKHEPAVDDENGVAVFEGHHVEADLTEPTQRDDLQHGVPLSSGRVPTALGNSRSAAARFPRRGVDRPTRWPRFP